MAQRKAFPLRLPPEVYEALRAGADDELLSVNAQIESLLVRALQGAGRKPKRRKYAAGGPKPGE